MESRIALIGFGEAAQAFADGAGWAASGFDLKGKRLEMAAAGVTACASAAEALDGAGAALCLVTADAARAAAESDAALLAPNALWLDMNSVAPGTKRAAARAIEAAGGRYVDVAVMSPVHPARRAAPLLVAGPHAEAGAELLRSMGFPNVRAVGPSVGSASAIKMIRSVMVKGMEALTAECVLAGEAAGVLEEVIASLNASSPGTDWAGKADYNLDRMMIHGVRRAAEMEEVVSTLDALGTGSAMTRGTVERQRAIGMLGIDPPHGLAAKIEALNPLRKDQAA